MLRGMISSSTPVHSASAGVVVAGGGLAAQRCTETLRRGGYDGSIRVLCAEPHLPYDRPPLSKSRLADGGEDDALAYRPPEWYASNDVDLLTGVRATGLDVHRRRVRLSTGEELRYQKLLIATGARPRELPVLQGYENVSVLRTLDDARELREVLIGRPRLAIIGAGFIGLEVAATARGMGCSVTVIEADRHPLRAVLGKELGQWFAGLHVSHGVTMRTGATVAQVEGSPAARALILSDGTRIEADHVLVGIGTVANVGWLADSPLADPLGVRVDAIGRTPLPDVFAAGDVAATFDRALGCHVPGSHWEAAGRQAAGAARLMLGQAPTAFATSSFWSDQYGLRIQYLGRRSQGDLLHLDGDPGDRSFAAYFRREGHVVAALLVNRPRELPAARKMIERTDT